MSLHRSTPPRPSQEAPSAGEAQAAPASTSAADAPALAPIIPLCEVRRKRQRLAASGQGRPKEPGPGQIPDPGQDQMQAFSTALQTGRLRSADLFAMVRLGVLTDDPALLPCADPNRRRNARDWERAYLDSGERPAPASEVGCPLMAQAASSGAPACVEALRAQAQLPRWDPDQGFLRRGPDPCDPVVLSELRPCLLLSRELFRHLLLPFWQDEP